MQKTGSGRLNLNIHLMCMDARMPRAQGCAGAAHMLFLDGVYVGDPDGTTRFRWVKAPTSTELIHLVHTIAQRIGRFLERQGLLERDAENNYLALDAVNEDPMRQLLGHSITCRLRQTTGREIGYSSNRTLNPTATQGGVTSEHP